MSIVKVFASWI